MDFFQHFYISITSHADYILGQVGLHLTVCRLKLQHRSKWCYNNAVSVHLASVLKQRAINMYVYVQKWILSQLRVYLLQVVPGVQQASAHHPLYLHEICHRKNSCIYCFIYCVSTQAPQDYSTREKCFPVVSQIKMSGIFGQTYCITWKMVKFLGFFSRS